MSKSADTAIGELHEAPNGDVRLAEHLEAIQSLLQSDILGVEQSLRIAVRESPEPASSAARHLVECGGKRVRPAAVLLSAACFGAIPDSAREIAAVVELIHNATLLHDDVIDDGDERRGAPTARRIWGNAVSVLAGDALLVSALERTWRHSPRLMQELLDTLRRLVAGEVVQLRGRRTLDWSERVYEQILADKTASLFRFAAASGAELAGADPRERTALGAFGERLGMAFQLVDDVLDYAGVETGKTMGADLLEGKLTLPLVLAAQQSSEIMRGVELVRAGDMSYVEVVRQQVIASGACTTVRNRAISETEAALAELDSIAPSPARLLLAEIARQVVRR